VIASWALLTLTGTSSALRPCTRGPVLGQRKKYVLMLCAMSPLQGFFFQGIFEWPRLRYIQ
jgi:hypothetical protein